jgi:hypothetical protein
LHLSFEEVIEDTTKEIQDLAKEKAKEMDDSVKDVSQKIKVTNWLQTARQGTAGHSRAQQGTAGHSRAQQGIAGHGRAQQGTARHRTQDTGHRIQNTVYNLYKFASVINFAVHMLYLWLLRLQEHARRQRAGAAGEGQGAPGPAPRHQTVSHVAAAAVVAASWNASSNNYRNGRLKFLPVNSQVVRLVS